MPAIDAQHDFLRARRRATVARLVARLRGEPDDVNVILPYEEVIQALGFVSERSLGLQVVPLDAIVGTIDRQHDFDRGFRPTSRRVRSRWEHIAAAMRRGEALPPVDLLKVGEIHFVRDGHHRVSVARALGHADIDAYVTDVVTRVDAGAAMKFTDLPVKSHERVFFERVPLPEEARDEISLSDPWDYAKLAEGVEAWGFRAMREEGELLDRSETARLWLEHEYRPVVAMLRDAGLITHATDTEAYMRIAAERYRLLRTHAWNEDVLARVVDDIAGGTYAAEAFASLAASMFSASPPARPRRPYAPRMPPGQRREQLIDAALEVLLERGYARISIEAIARAAGITRPVVYDHFPNLNRLLHAVIEREERISLEQLAAVVPDDPGDQAPRELLARGVTRFLEAVTARPATWRLILLPLEGTPPIVREHVEAGRARVLERIERLARWALERSDTPRQIDVELTARAIRDWSEQAGRMVLTDPERYPPERYERFAHAFLDLLARA